MTSFNKLIKKPKGLRLNTLKARNVYASPIIGNGLLEGTTDLIGGAFLQDNIKGNTSGAVFTVTAGGSRLCYHSSEDAKHAGTQLESLYRDINVITK